MFASRPRRLSVTLAALLALLTLAGLAGARGPRATARQADPTPVYAAGVTAEILGRNEPAVAPGYALQLVRITFAPGASVAAHRHSGATVTYGESGTHGFTVLEGNARIVRAGMETPVAGVPPGEPMELGREYTINPGDVLLFDETVVHTAHNPTGEPAVLVESQLRAVDRPLTEFVHEMATPVA